YSGWDSSISCASRISFSYCTGIGSFRFRRLLTRPGSFARVAIVDRRGVGLSDRLSPQDLPPLEVVMDDIIKLHGQRPTAVSRSSGGAEEGEGPVHGAAGPSGGLGGCGAPGPGRGADG